MSYREQRRATAPRTRPIGAAVLALTTAVLLGVALEHRTVAHAIGAEVAGTGVLGLGGPGRGLPHAVTVDDGVVPDGVTAFDDRFPAVADLDPDLAGAVRAASRAAARDGVEIVVTSGWRSAAYQDELLREAVSEYGSEEEAARWVATADTSPHVTGDAVDLGHGEATRWLSEHGRAYGLCRIYRNEPWHYELRPDAAHAGCPAEYADPTHDPRMHR